MRKTLLLARREYKEAVRSRGFIIMLLLMPLLMSGSTIAMVLLKDKVDTTDQVVAVIDRSGVVFDALLAAAEKRNAEEIRDLESGQKDKPAYIFEAIAPDDGDPLGQRFELSERVRRGELHAFLEIGPDVLHPGDDQERNRIAYHAENAALDELRGWLGRPINTQLRRTRVMELGVPEEQTTDLFDWIYPTSMGLVTIDEETGEVRDAEQTSELQVILAPMVMAILYFMMMMMGAMPLLGSVSEEKSQRIAEVLLGSLKPFQFMMGKIIGGVGLSLTCSAVYVITGIIALRKLGVEQMIPYDLLPWFFTYVILGILMQGSILAAFGAASNDAKEAQSLAFPGMAGTFIPMMVLFPVINQPTTVFATVMSLFPPFTPMLMLVRLGSPVQIPSWQPWAGLAGVLLFAVLAVWAGGRVFRVAILMSGSPPRPGNLVRWAIKG